MASEDSDYVDHNKRKREYLGYLDTKQNEILEQQTARRYYHGSQYTAEQIRVLNRRRQPIVTYNRVGRKINAVVGLLERNKQDPKGFPRTPQHEEGAEVATAVLRYVCDEQHWQAKALTAGLNSSIDGIGGVELTLISGDVGDTEIGIEEVDPSSFFYDPRSLKSDFSDARYMGTGKWADVDATIALFPDKKEEILNSIDTGGELTSYPDSDRRWFRDVGDRRQVRVVDHWYMKGNDWYWCIYTGATILAEGKTPFLDEKKRDICKYVMYSANIDQDGDRYGFIRNMKSSQDEINQRRSKGLHQLNSRRMIIPKGSGNDLESVRTEAARPDGVIEFVGEIPPSFDDAAKAQELQGQLAFLEDAKNEIENYGFNPALIGQGVDQLSGRAIQLQQQAGVAELGPYLVNNKNWKLRVYRAIWCAVQEHWTGERWVRVTDNDGLAQFFAVNQLQLDPATMQMVMTNQLGALDVDIILDEGPDVINMQQDAYDTISIMAQKGQQVPPQLVIELSPLAGSVKKKALDIIEQAQQQAAQPNPVAIAGAQAELEKTRSETAKNMASAQKLLADAGQAGNNTGETGPSEIDIATALADIRAKNASAEKTKADTLVSIATADQIRTTTGLAPVEMSYQMAEDQLNRKERLVIHQDTMANNAVSHALKAKQLSDANSRANTQK
jgi:hypothetical protein